MKNISIRKFGISTGLVGSLIYTACFLIVLVLGKGTLVTIANTLFHGIDFTNIMRMNIPIFESLIGIILSFFFWGTIGGLISFFYNKIK